MFVASRIYGILGVRSGLRRISTVFVEPWIQPWAVVQHRATSPRPAPDSVTQIFGLQNIFAVFEKLSKLSVNYQALFLLTLPEGEKPRMKAICRVIAFFSIILQLQAFSLQQFPAKSSIRQSLSSSHCRIFAMKAHAEGAALDRRQLVKLGVIILGGTMAPRISKAVSNTRVFCRELLR